MRRALLLIAGTALLATALGAFAPVARSSCAAPTLAVEPQSVVAGDEITVTGEFWTGDCNDVITCTQGCLGERCTGGGPAGPATGISLILRPLGGNSGTDTELLSSIDADQQLTFTATTTVPRLAPGRYELVGGSLDTGVAARTIVRIR